MVTAIQCKICKLDLAVGDLVIDLARFSSIEGVFDGWWLANPSNKTYLFKSQENPNIRTNLTHRGCFLAGLTGLSFEEVGTRGFIGGGLFS